MIIAGTVDSALLGNYSITYTATDKAGNSANASRTVVIALPPDTTPPNIVLNGDSSITLTQGDIYEELGGNRY